MMDDAMKLKVLMIYYDHWGKDEIKARKISYGIKETMDILKARYEITYIDEEDGEDEEDKISLETRLRRYFYYLCNEDLHYLWTEFAEIFLSDCGGCIEPSNSLDDYYDNEDLLIDRKLMLEDNLNILNEETADIIYDNDFGYEQALSVDAIVALF